MSQTLGPFELLEPLGEGGSATVWRARRLADGRQVALKRLHVGTEGESRKRFLREIRITSRLAHPCIVKMLDFGDQEGVPFYAMEVVDGETLSAVIERARKQSTAVLDLPAFWRLADDLTAALEYLHSEKVLHRDIKPSNIFLERSGRTLLADFGLSRAVDSTRITHSGEVMGTPNYMAPEQWQGLRVAAATDIYQMGLVFHEVLTGRLPFSEQPDAASMFAARVNRPLPLPSSFNPLVPACLDGLVVRCLAPSPAERPSDGAVLRRELLELQAGSPGPRLQTARRPSAASPDSSGPAGPAFRTARALAVAAAAGFGSLVAALWISGRTAAPLPAAGAGSEAAASAPTRAGTVDLAVQPASREALLSFRTAAPARSRARLRGPDGTRELAVSAAPATLHTTWLHGLTPATDYTLAVIVIPAEGPSWLSTEKRFSTAP